MADNPSEPYPPEVERIIYDDYQEFFPEFLPLHVPVLESRNDSEEVQRPD